MSEVLKTPLHDVHVAAGGRMVEFAQYLLPVQYKSVIQESKAVRISAGMFDVSHMARLTMRGNHVLEFLEHVTTNDVAKLTDGIGQYSMLPNATGGIVDDIIVYRMTHVDFRMVVNAANHAKDLAHLKEQNRFGVEISDVTAETAMIAVQGPDAVNLMKPLSDKPDELDSVGMFGVVMTEIAGKTCFCARSGYTGEDGYEIVTQAADAEYVWNSLEEAGVEPCGLGARDVLRVEAGLPLYGHELREDLSPISAGLGWVISKSKDFLGSEYIQTVRTQGSPQKLQGVKMASRRLPSPEMKIYVEGEMVGEVSSGVFSPLFDCGIGFAFVNANIALGTRCEVDVRGSREQAEIVSKRFFKRA